MIPKKPSSKRVEQAAVVKTIGVRIREARELCNMSQSAAAKRFGYSNPSKLSKVEGATDTNSVPLWLIAHAAKVYEVSIDYLFGASDDWEAGARMTQERDVSGWLFEAFEATRKREMDTLKLLHRKVDAMESSIAAMMDASDETCAAMRRFRELNPEFDDMKAGSRLAATIDRVSDTAKNARVKMARFRVECTIAAPSTNQLSLLI